MRGPPRHHVCVGCVIPARSALRAGAATSDASALVTVARRCYGDGVNELTLTIDHVSLSVEDLERAKNFYSKALAPLGMRIVGEVTPEQSGSVGFVGFGVGRKGSLWVAHKGRQTPTTHICFRAPTRAAVRDFHAAALEAGGRDNGAPGVRPEYHNSYYAAFVLSPEGHNIEAVCFEDESTGFESTSVETIAYAVDGDAFDAVIAYPEGPGPHPAVLVCHAWGGRDGFAEARASQLTEMGYVGAAIDVYGVGKRGHDQASSRELMMALVDQPAVLRSRLAAAHRAICELPRVDADRVGVIGYCFGGLCSILCARMGLPLRGAVSFHGLLEIGEPLDAKGTAPILVLHGQDDPMVPPADLAAFAEEMQRIGADWQLHAYPGAAHAFTNPSANNPAFGTVYNEDVARRSWREMARFFADVLA